MKQYVALLRAVNVGGSGKLLMKDLSSICEKIGYQDVQTYIQSGNVIFKSDQPKKVITDQLEKALYKKMGTTIDVFLRTQIDLETTLANNPFKNQDNKKVGVFFQKSSIKKTQQSIECPTGESVVYGKKEIYIYYKIGMGKSKLKLPKESGTVRNMNTIQKLFSLMKDSES